MVNVVAAGVIFAMALWNAARAQQTQSSPRSPVPDAPAQKDAEKTIHDVFKEEYAKRSAADKAALSKKLFDQGLQTKDDLASQFVLFRECRDLATQAGDCDMSIRAIDEMARRFVVDAASMKSAVVGTILKNAKTPEELVGLVRVQLKAADEAVATDQYDLADKIAESAIAMAKRAKDMALIVKAETQRKAIADLRSRFDKVKKSKEVLAASPQDPAASTIVGEYECLQKGNWKGGLPLLAQGADANLKAAAEKDLAGPSAGAEQAAAGDAWWDLIEKQGGRAKEAVRGRAVFWYEQSLSKLTGLSKSKVEKRLGEVRAQHLAQGSWLDASDPKSFSKTGSAGDPVELVAKAGYYLAQQMTTFPKGEFDAVSVRVRFDSSQGTHAWVIFDGADSAAFVDSKQGTFVATHKEGTTWKHDFEVKWAKRDECVFTILLVDGAYVLYLDNQEMTRVKTPLTRITALSLRVEGGLVKFDRIRFRKAE
jgi:hypothetical protein